MSRVLAGALMAGALVLAACDPNADWGAPSTATGIDIVTDRFELLSEQGVFCVEARDSGDRDRFIRQCVERGDVAGRAWWGRQQVGNVLEPQP